MEPEYISTQLIDLRRTLEISIEGSFCLIQVEVKNLHFNRPRTPTSPYDIEIITVFRKLPQRWH
jgi:hypothetical protein